MATALGEQFSSGEAPRSKGLVSGTAIESYSELQSFAARSTNGAIARIASTPSADAPAVVMVRLTQYSPKFSYV